MALYALRPRACPRTRTRGSPWPPLTLSRVTPPGGGVLGAPGIFIPLSCPAPPLVTHRARMRVNSRVRDGKLRCGACGEFKVPDEFPRDPSRRHGRHRHCSACRRTRRASRSRGCLDCGAARELRHWYCAECGDRRAKATKSRERRAVSPEALKRRLARWVVRRARKLGCLPEGDKCARCGATEGIELHHRSGFAHLRDWLNVEPLCADCHRREHSHIAGTGTDG